MPKTPSWDSGTISEPRVRMTASAQRTKMDATATAPEPADKDTTVTAAKSTTAPPMPVSSHRIRRRSSGDERRYRRYSMMTPRTIQAAKVYCSAAATGSSGRADGRNSGLAIAGSAGWNKPSGGVGLATSSSTGSAMAIAAAMRSAQRSPGRSGTPVGNSPISPIPATTEALDAHSPASTTTQAKDAPATTGRSVTASPRQIPSMNVVPAASSQTATGWPGPGNAPTSPATQNVGGPASTQPTPAALPAASSITTAAISAQPPMTASTMLIARIGPV